MKKRSNLSRFIILLIAAALIAFVLPSGADDGTYYSDWIQVDLPRTLILDADTAGLEVSLWSLVAEEPLPLSDGDSVPEQARLRAELVFTLHETPEPGTLLRWDLPEAMAAEDCGWTEQADCRWRVQGGALLLEAADTARIGVTLDFALAAPEDGGEILLDFGAAAWRLHPDTGAPAERVLTAELPFGAVLVRVPPEAQIPGTACLTAMPVEDGTPYLESVMERLDLAEGELTDLRLMDLTITDGGAVLEPAAPVRVELRMDVEGEELRVMHFPSPAGDLTVSPRGRRRAPASPGAGAQVIDAEVRDGVITFEADGFSVYAVAGITFSRRITASDGAAYEVTVVCPDAAGIPEDAVLRLAELLPGSEGREEALERAAAALSDADRLAFVAGGVVFDIGLVSEGAAVEPLSPVTVRIRCLEPVERLEDTECAMVHLGADGAEVLPVTSRVEDGRITRVSFSTPSFSSFAFAQAKYIGALNGQSFAIVRDNGSNKVALLGEAHPSVANRLAASYVNILEDGQLTPVTTANGSVERDEVDITAWTFEHVRDNLYYLRADNGKYLRINGTTLTLSDEPALVDVLILGASNKAHSTNIRLRSGDDPRYNLNLKSGNPSQGFQSTTAADGNGIITLYQAEGSEPLPLTTARKVSAGDLLDAAPYVIFQRVYNEDQGVYENYAVAGDGSLVYIYDEGDYVAYRSDAATAWYFIEHVEDGEVTGYYEFYNPVTGKYLAPQAGGILSDAPLGLLLSGRTSGGYNSRIEGWDSGAWAYYGLGLDVENRQLVSGTGSDSTSFSFARVITPVQEATPVATVDSKSKGIRIRMYNFPNNNRNAMNAVLDGNNLYVPGSPVQGLVRRTLGPDGLPVSKNGVSFSQLYGGSYYRGEANHLFLQSTYSSSGYYEYNSYLNAAEYDQSTGNFTVYDQRVTPSSTTGNKTTYLRGNYLPFNHIDMSRPSLLTNQFETTTDWLDLEDPQFDGPLYLTQEAVDYHFGTIVDANFVQAKSGLDERGNPIVYEFSGDDDLWVFIDGVLVLDLGGIHSALNGSIDFATGQVRAGGTSTTIRESFRLAGVFPDGTPWNDSLAETYFTGDTFNDYSGHKMTMVYQERGEGASTLRVKFNLPVVESGTFAVEKKLEGTNQLNYANVQFAYQAFLEPDKGDPIPIVPGLIFDGEGHLVPESSATEDQLANRVTVTYENNGEDLDFYNGIPIGDRTYDGVFYLRPGEAAVFGGIPDDVKYFVQEIDVSGAFYDTVMINEANLGEDEGLTEDSNITARSSSKTIQQRQRVLFANHCSPRNVRDLWITKHVDNPTGDGATFEFRVLLEGRDGSLTYYSRDDYCLVREVDGELHYFTHVNGQLTDIGTEETVCSQSGAYGTIAGVPDGYSVVIKGLLAGTDFRVEEIRNSAGYLQIAKDLEDGSYDPSDIPEADGQIRLGRDAKMTFVNHRYSTISLEKTWNSGDLVTAHGELTFGLYETADGAERLARRGSVLRSEPVQTVAWPGTSAIWYLDLPAGMTLDDYTVYELTPDGEGGWIPVGDGQAFLLTGETGADGEPVDHYYGAAYQRGEPVGSQGIFARADTVTNTVLPDELRAGVSGVKILNGRNMREGEFTFLLEPLYPEEGYPGMGGIPAFTAHNGAAAEGEPSRFTFPDLVYTPTDYNAALHRTPEGDAVFWYLVTEEPGGDDLIVYAENRYLVRVILRMTGDGMVLEGPTAFRYDEELLAPAGEFTASR